MSEFKFDEQRSSRLYFCEFEDELPLADDTGAIEYYWVGEDNALNQIAKIAKTMTTERIKDFIDNIRYVQRYKVTAEDEALLYKMPTLPDDEIKELINSYDLSEAVLFFDVDMKRTYEYEERNTYNPEADALPRYAG